MPRPSNYVPVYARHKAKNLAYCNVKLANGQSKTLYLGPWKSAESKNEHARIIAVVAANNGIYPDGSEDLTINEAMVRYVKHVDAYYQNPDGTPADSALNIKTALRPMKELFGPTPIRDFGPVQLKAIRAVLIEKGIVRKQVNKFAGIIRQFFRWCVESEIVESSVWETLRAVSPLMPGRSGAVEGTPREPADPVAVEKALPFMSPAVQAVVQLLRLTGARPTEILTMKPSDLDRCGDVWKYSPAAHKTAWKGKSRTIYIGPDAKAVLVPWLLGTPSESYIFSPARSEEMRSRQRGDVRKTPLYPSHAKRNELKRARKRKLPPSEVYDHNELARAVLRACKRANVKPFSPYQLRHLRAVELRVKFGLEMVRAVLGQTAASMADHYSKYADETLATRAAAEVG